jgi:hypothetical protein
MTGFSARVMPVVVLLLAALGGRIAAEPPVGSAVARAGQGLAMFDRVDGLDASDMHRSVYLPVVRDRVPESLALFDFADPSLVTGERAPPRARARSRAPDLPLRRPRHAAGRRQGVVHRGIPT